MKIARLLSLLLCFFMYLLISSCKKTNQTTIQTLFTGGTWQLASVIATYYTGNSADSTVALNATCSSKQFFTFNADKTCTYTNFDCILQTPPSASWSLSPDQLILMADVVCKDTTAARSSMPFAYAGIVNLGQFSLVLNTGDIQPNYSLTKKRKIIQYGFVRIKQ